MDTEPPKAESQVIDADELLQRCLGRIELVERVLNVFQNRLDKDLDELESSLVRGDTAAVKLIAHRIKGSAASASAHSVSEQAALIEERAQEASPDEMRGRLDGLKQLRDACQTNFKQLGTNSGVRSNV